MPDRAAKRRARRGEVLDPPTDPETEALIDGWFELGRRTAAGEPDPPWDDDPALDAWSEVLRFVSDEPDRAWPLVLRLVARADEVQIWNVAAGPLEDFIGYHGEVFVERIRARARQDEKFRDALVGVWGWEALPKQVSAALLPFLPPNWKPHMPGHLGLGKPPESRRKKT